MNSPLFITGTDTASGEEFSYTYANSMETITVVPEPASVILFGFGMMTLFVRVGRRRERVVGACEKKDV
jgi:hypothetical protein